MAKSKAKTASVRALDISLDICTRITDLSDVFIITGTTMEEVMPYATPKDDYQLAQCAAALIQLITRAYNGNTVLDWNNNNQSKFAPYWMRRNGGWVLDYVPDDYWSARLGAGFYFAERRFAEDAANKFIQVYLNWLPK